MAKRVYADTLKRTRKELELLRGRRRDLDAQIAKLEQLELALSGVTEPQEPDLSSLTAVIRNVLTFAVEPLTPIQVRDKVLTVGFDRGPYSQFMASVHVVLKRLVKKHQVLEFKFADRKTYWWVKKIMPPGSYPENLMLGKYYSSYRDEDLQSSQSYEEIRKSGKL